MQDLLGSLLGSMNAGDLAALSRQLGTDEDTTGRAVSAALPAMLGALARNTAQESGAQAFAGALDRDHDGSILDDIGGFLGSGQSSTGDAILGHVLGGRRDMVASNVANSAGLDLGLVQKLLPLLAPLLLGYLGRTKRQQGLDAGSLAGMLGGATRQMDSSSPGLLGSLLDADGDGDATDDVLRLGSSLLGGLLGGGR